MLSFLSKVISLEITTIYTYIFLFAMAGATPSFVLCNLPNGDFFTKFKMTEEKMVGWRGIKHDLCNFAKYTES